VARYKKTTRVPRPHRQDLRQAQEAGVVTLPPPSNRQRPRCRMLWWVDGVAVVS
jgi:hypothetical protein